MSNRRKKFEIGLDDINEYVATQDDFALELAAHNIALAEGYFSSHAGTYTDPNTGKTRQYDVRIVRVLAEEQKRIDIALECKSISTNFPLVVSRVPRSEGESVSSFITSYRPAEHIAGIGKTWAPASVHRVSPYALYSPDTFVGKAMAQVGRNGEGELIRHDGETFEKWNQAFSSAADLVQAGWLAAVDSENRIRATAVFAVLVVSDGNLWAVDYDSTGAVLEGAHRVNHVDYYLGKQYPGPGNLTYDISHLNIVTKSELGTFLRRLTDPEISFYGRILN